MAVILASQSPRRKQLLEMLGVEFTVIPAKGEEVIPAGAGPKETVRALTEAIASDPAWAGLSAVKNNKFITLPQELFHYKPNHRWGESYAYLAEILYG